MSNALSCVEPLLNQWSAVLEGDVFEALRPCSCVIRSFEFAVADGAIDCAREFDPLESYAARFWQVYSRNCLEFGEFALFDIKSTIGLAPGKQRFVSTVGQKRRVAFHIGIAFADARFVEVIPNMQQDGHFLEEPISASDRRLISSNTARVSRLPDSAHHSLDQSGNPYRMHISLLPEAIRRVRRHILGLEIYVNPGTGVRFPQWRPITTRNVAWLKPSEESPHYTAFEEAIKIYTALRVKSRLRFDFMGLQPVLADFKLVREVPMGMRALAIKPESGQDLVQYFCQHKADGHLRAKGSPLKSVAIARGDDYYFDSRKR